MFDCEEIVGQFPSPLLILQFSKTASEAIRTDSAFQCYIHVTEDEMVGMKWLEEKVEDSGMMDTYMDT